MGVLEYIVADGIEAGLFFNRGIEALNTFWGFCQSSEKKRKAVRVSWVDGAMFE